MQEDAIGGHALSKPGNHPHPVSRSPKACQNRSSGLQIAAAPPTKQVRFIGMGKRLSGSWKNCSTEAEAERFMAKVISSDMTCRRYPYSPNCWRKVALPGTDIREARFKSRSATFAISGASRAALAIGELPYLDAHLAGLVDKVLRDTGTRKGDDADGKSIQHCVVALEGGGVPMAGPVRLEHDL